MYTQCPSCHTVFRLGPAQLSAAAGTVRCGVCGCVFQAAERLLQELPVYLQLAVPSGGASPRGPAASGRRPVADPAALGAAYYGRAGAAVQRRGRTAWGWATGIVVAMTLLILQFAYFERADLARQAQLRPAIAHMCRLLHCGLPPQRDLTRIAVVNRQVYEDPGAPGALLVTAVIENHASFPQPFPLLQLTLSGIDGKLLAQGRFTPGQYLANAPPDSLMAPGRPARVKLEIADPGQNATSFEFAFL